ncbi:MAG: ABC transporter permease subunit [Dehalococcoidia bacterium]
MTLRPRRRLFRSRRTQRFAIQAAFLAGFALVLVYLVARARTLDLGLGFLESPAGFALANEWAVSHNPNASRLDAYVVGVWNTIRLVVVGIGAATVLGIVAGVARLSSNWLVARLATLYIESVRNTPLLVQIIFWWLAVFLAMPAIADRRHVLELAYLSNRGLALPWFTGESLALLWFATLPVALLAGWWVRRTRVRTEDMTGRSTYPNAAGLATVVGIAAVTFVAMGLPLRPTVPEIVESGAAILRYEGGVVVTPQFAAVLFALVVYTGSFIAEIVRASIQALPRGQTEAAMALGLNGYQRLTLVILPQALRTMIPPLTNQYLNLTKNSSLAIVVGYSELLFVGNVIINNAGHAVPMFILVILTYQVMSFVISGGMNFLNRRLQLAGRS